MKKQHEAIRGVAAVLSTLCFAQVASAGPAENIWSLGIEGFHDDYKESEGDVNDKTNYGSVTAGYTRDFGHYFLAANGRVSYGTDNYSSDTGTSSGAPQWETEGRLRGGMTINFHGDTLSPYVGAGVRWFTDEGKGAVTSTGALGYDRRITQYYIPIGATYTHDMGDGWAVSPNLEIDPVPYGSVSTRLANIGGPNVINTQHDGVGARGELMFGQNEGGFNWQVGPFVRYWYFPNSGTSDCGLPGPGECLIEPKNTRTQVGLALRVLW